MGLGGMRVILREPMGVKTGTEPREGGAGAGVKGRGAGPLQVRPLEWGVPSRGSDCPLRLPGRGRGGSRQPGAPERWKRAAGEGAEAVAGAGIPSRAQGELLGNAESKRLLSAAEAGKTLLGAGADLSPETRRGVWAAPGVRAGMADS